MQPDPASEALTDLRRASWIIFASRAEIYREWANHDERFDAARARAERGAEVLATALATEKRSADHGLVEGHASWMASLVGADPNATPLADWFMIRMGEWVEAHTGEFMEAGRDELRSLLEADRAMLEVPESWPVPPPFEPVTPIPVEPPGEIRFRFAILGDLHIGSPLGETMAREAIGEINSSGASLVIQLGDITDHGNKEEFETAAHVLGEMDAPFQVMLGNHDIYSYDEKRLSGLEYFESFFGRPGHGVLTEHEGIRFAVLDSAENLESPFSPYNLITGQFDEGSGGAVVRGSLSAIQHDLLAEVAAAGSSPAFVFLHHPPQPFVSFPPVVFGLRDADSGRLHAACDSGNIWGVFAGHTHRNKKTQPFGQVPVQEIAIARDFPFGYALVDVAENGYAYRWIQLSNRELIERGYQTAGEIFRRYSTGVADDRAFSWTAPVRP